MKRLCAKEALKFVPDQGKIGLGGGETIGYLAENIKEAGKHVTVITPSETTRKKMPGIRADGRRNWRDIRTENSF